MTSISIHVTSCLEKSYHHKKNNQRKDNQQYTIVWSNHKHETQFFYIVDKKEFHNKKNVGLITLFYSST